MNWRELYDALKEVKYRLESGDIEAAKRLLDEAIKSPWLDEDGY